MGEYEDNNVNDYDEKNKRLGNRIEMGDLNERFRGRKRKRIRRRRLRREMSEKKKIKEKKRRCMRKRDEEYMIIVER